MGTFSKSLASIGGFIASDKETINYLRHNSRSYIFSASNTPAATAAAGAALDIMLSEPERIEHLWKLTHYALDGFRNMGCEIGHTSTPIIPLFIRNNDLTFLIVKELFEAGIFVNPVVSPAVAPEDTLIRFSLMATHTIEQLDYALEAIHKVFKSHSPSQINQHGQIIPKRAKRNILFCLSFIIHSSFATNQIFLTIFVIVRTINTLYIPDKWILN